MKLLKQLETLQQAGTVVGLSDGQLLARFLQGSDAFAEAAFAALVDRHGGMVLRVCRQVLGHEQDAQDASQAAFLILARKAGSISRGQSVASWLYGVALRVARRARLAAARRQKREHRGGAIMAARRAAQVAGDGEQDSDRWTRLHTELGRLPESFRAPLVLCYLQGLTQEQAAAQLHCPLGTVQSRLARGRAKLKSRLEAHGGNVSSLLLTPTLPGEHLLRAPDTWAEATVRLAMEFARAKGSAAVGAGVASAALAEEVLRAFVMIKLKVGLAAVLLLAGMAISDAAIWAGQGGAQADGRQAPSAAIARREQVSTKPRIDPPVESPLVNRTVRGTVRDAQGRPVPKVWFGDAIIPRSDRWHVIEPFDRVRQREEPFRDSQGRVVPPGPLGKYYEVRDDQGRWKAVRPGDIRVYAPRENLGNLRPSPFAPAISASVKATLASAQTVYELRARRWEVMSPGRGDSFDRTDRRGQFEAKISFISEFPATQILFASADFSHQAVHVARITDPDRPVEVTLLPARDIRARVIETPMAAPDEETKCDLYTVDPAHAALYDIPAIGTRGAYWGNPLVEKGGVEPPSARNRSLTARLPPGRYIVRFQSDVMYDIEELMVPPGDGPVELPDISIKPLAWVSWLGVPAHEIQAINLEGKPVSLVDYRGKVIVLIFWSSRGNPLGLPFPNLVQVLDRFKDKPLIILAIHDASITSLADFKHALEPIRSQIPGGTSIRWLLDEVPGGKGRRPSLRAGEVGSGRTEDLYELEDVSVLVVDRTGHLATAISSSRYVTAFKAEKQGKLGRDDYDVPDEGVEAVSKTVVRAIEGTLEEQFGLPRSPRPEASPKPEDTIEMRKPLPRGPIVIKGKVIDREARDLPGASVRYDVAKEKSVKTGPGGEFSFTQDRIEGSGLFIAIESRGMATRGFALRLQPHMDAKHLGLDEVLVESSGMIAQPLQLGPGAIVQGHVSRNGRPVEGATVGLNYATSGLGLLVKDLTCRTDAQGFFILPHVLPQSDGTVFVELGSLDKRGAVIPRRLHTEGEGSTLDTGILEVQPGRKLAGRLICSDGKPLPRGIALAAIIPGAGWLMAEADARQQFEFNGIPDGPITLQLVPRKDEKRLGYHFSHKNLCLNPSLPSYVEGRIDHDILDLRLLLDPGEPVDYSGFEDIDRTILADFNDAKTGPITGVPPGAYPAK